MYIFSSNLNYAYQFYPFEVVTNETYKGHYRICLKYWDIYLLTLLFIIFELVHFTTS